LSILGLSINCKLFLGRDKSSKTTEIYTRVSTKAIKNVKSPLDDLDI